MAKIEMYTTPFCGYCARAKSLLEKKGAAYEEMDVMDGRRASATEMRERAKRSTVPQIFINGQHIGGSDELAGARAGGQARRHAGPAGLRGLSMTTAFKAGLIQTNVSNEMAENVAFVREQARLAPRRRRRLHHDAGEYRPDRRQPRRDAWRRRRPKRATRCWPPAAPVARETGAWFLLGSIHVRVPGEEQIRNRSFLFDAKGRVAARLRQDPHVRRQTSKAARAISKG